MDKMNPKYIITRDEENHYTYNPGDSVLAVMEFFYDTIQGEGVSAGRSASFLRLKGCTLDCVWCDTEWRKGNIYLLDDIFSRMEEANLISKFKGGQMLVLTGGSPLHQQGKLLDFLSGFRNRYGFIPRLEVENECTLFPEPAFVELIDQWNNSPKLTNSYMKRNIRHKPEIIKYLSGLVNSWFKFVIEVEEDWEEIQMDFIDPGLINKDQIILMPLASDLKELHHNEHTVEFVANRYGVQYTSRKQLEIGVP